MKRDPRRNKTVEQLSALAHSTRFDVFRLLIKSGRDGLSAGTIADQLGIAPNTLSNHLAVLSQAGLIGVERDGRRLIYTASIVMIAELIQSMVQDCCDGDPEICGLVQDFCAAE